MSKLTDLDDVEATVWGRVYAAQLIAEAHAYQLHAHLLHTMGEGLPHKPLSPVEAADDAIRALRERRASSV